MGNKYANMTRTIKKVHHHSLNWISHNPKKAEAVRGAQSKEHTRRNQKKNQKNHNNAHTDAADIRFRLRDDDFRFRRPHLYIQVDQWKANYWL